MKKGARVNLATALLTFAISILFIALVIAVPDWIVDPPSSIENATLGIEDTNPSVLYNISANVTNTTAGEVFSYEFSTTGENPYSILSSIYGSSQENSFYSWISLNSTTGILTINSVSDNQTGQFNITIDVKNQDNLGAGARIFYFIINATNDAPNFTAIEVEYNLTENQTFLEHINATDEEEHYPLTFIINFTSCIPADWSTRTSPNDCQLFNFTNASNLNFANISALMNFTPTNNDVGVYQANISVIDYGENYTCSSTHCETDYSQNQTTYYITNVTFNVFATLAINATDCQNKIFQENQSSTCQINITSHGSADSINISSLATVRNYAATVANSSWFFATNQTTTSANIKTIDINVTPQKTEIGNWTINFTVQNLDYPENLTVQVYVLVNRTLNDAPDIIDVANQITSKSALTQINLTVHDDDLLIPDKFEGYNETINFTITILNQSDLTQELPLQNFTAQILYMPVSGTNRTEAKIEFTPNATEPGNYTINLTINDLDNVTDVTWFNLTILDNLPPEWNETLGNIYEIQVYENNYTYFNLSQNVTDPENNTLAFTFTNDSAFPSFTLNVSTGEMNFTGGDADVGYHNITITASDGYLTDVQEFNITILNVDDTPLIESLPGLQSTNVSGDTTVGINVTEDNATILELRVKDDDFLIPANQKSFYNENVTINLTIEGPNTNLFNFTVGYSYLQSVPERRAFNAIFTPNKSDVGSYNITMNISDVANLSVYIAFNLTVLETQHYPSMTQIGNQIFSILNDTFYLDINTTDTEDINETAQDSNITYKIENLTAQGNFLTINSSTGVINFTFNDTYKGFWTYNLSVNDSSGFVTWEIFNVTVYDYPSINIPNSSVEFNFKENTTSFFNISTNHTVGMILNDSLNYSLYINGVLKNTTVNGSGNGTYFQWFYTPNFTEETTCSGTVNFTLNVTNPKLSTQVSWNLTINYTNYPLSFDTDVTDIDAGSPSEITLSTYFSDPDASDSCHNQTIGFNYSEYNASGGAITVAVVNWSNGTTPTSTFSASTEGWANYTFYALEYNESNTSQVISSAASNNFSVHLTSSTETVEVPTSGGGGGGSSVKKVKEKVSFKILVPEPVKAKKKDSFTVPIGVINDGDVLLNTITLDTSVTKDEILVTDMTAKLSTQEISSLSAQEFKNLTLAIEVDTEEAGTYEITIAAEVTNPIHLEWENFYVEIEEEENIKEKILFTEEFIIGNPQCAELKELIDEARELLEQGSSRLAQEKTDEALEACKRAIAQEPRSRIIDKLGNRLFGFLGIASITAFVAGFVYYYYKRIKLKRQLRGY